MNRSALNVALAVAMTTAALGPVSGALAQTNKEGGGQNTEPEKGKDAPTKAPTTSKSKSREGGTGSGTEDKTRPPPPAERSKAK
jgi:hypothetical protein